MHTKAVKASLDQVLSGHPKSLFFKQLCGVGLVLVVGLFSFIDAGGRRSTKQPVRKGSLASSSRSTATQTSSSQEHITALRARIKDMNHVPLDKALDNIPTDDGNDNSATREEYKQELATKIIIVNGTTNDIVWNSLLVKLSLLKGLTCHGLVIFGAAQQPPNLNQTNRISVVFLKNLLATITSNLLMVYNIKYSPQEIAAAAAEPDPQQGWLTIASVDIVLNGCNQAVAETIAKSWARCPVTSIYTKHCDLQDFSWLLGIELLDHFSLSIIKCQSSMGPLTIDLNLLRLLFADTISCVLSYLPPNVRLVSLPFQPATTSTRTWQRSNDSLLDIDLDWEAFTRLCEMTCQVPLKIRHLYLNPRKPQLLTQIKDTYRRYKQTQDPSRPRSNPITVDVLYVSLPSETPCLHSDCVRAAFIGLKAYMPSIQNYSIFYAPTVHPNNRLLTTLAFLYSISTPAEAMVETDFPVECIKQHPIRKEKQEVAQPKTIDLSIFIRDPNYFKQLHSHVAIWCSCIHYQELTIQGTATTLDAKVKAQEGLALFLLLQNFGNLQADRLTIKDVCFHAPKKPQTTATSTFDWMKRFKKNYAQQPLDDNLLFKRVTTLRHLTLANVDEAIVCYILKVYVFHKGVVVELQNCRFTSLATLTQAVNLLPQNRIKELWAIDCQLGKIESSLIARQIVRKLYISYGHAHSSGPNTSPIRPELKPLYTKDMPLVLSLRDYHAHQKTRELQQAIDRASTIALEVASLAELSEKGSATSQDQALVQHPVWKSIFNGNNTSRTAQQLIKSIVSSVQLFSQAGKLVLSTSSAVSDEDLQTVQTQLNELETLHLPLQSIEVRCRRKGSVETVDVFRANAPLVHPQRKASISTSTT
ncbi:hypothetical protein NEHOM01_0856 [Nematocida homosporus]|uniref:uncharacterized protein n=1 Tax=Nematocida homosporus TaxID=1912981 RepID=UPI00221FD62C|nr:uncharacterized protein NEHOM01_0856 [Nematocida homosporus]KAI5185497.1 hypothetical protein NEHOM01_0856 [Nematocida homosporus]